MTCTRRQIALGLLGGALAAPPLLAQASMGSGRFPSLDTLGVNTHLGQGENPQQVARSLQFLGLRHIRDAVPVGHFLPSFMRVLNGRVRLTAIVGPRRPLTDTIAALEAIERVRPGTLAAVEGPNEVNNFPIAYKGLTGSDAAVPFQNDLYRAVRASPALGHVPVIAFTNIGLQDSLSDFLNFHPYPPGGNPLSRRLPVILQRVRRSSTPTKPIQFTEFGYSTVDVSEQQQADLLLSGWRDAVAAGVRRVFIYQLSDFYRDRMLTGEKPAHHYGLFDLQYRPKLAAKAIADVARG